MSLVPSDWQFSPILVNWHQEGGIEQIKVDNYWDADILESKLRSSQPPLRSWSDLQLTARTRYPGLVFAQNSFGSLAGQPFRPSVARSLLSRLEVLHVLKSSFDEHGNRTPDGHQLYEKHFTGDTAWFSDSSAREKHDFRTELTFPDPTQPTSSLFCPWHGKVKSTQLRIHFSWPVSARRPLYIVYIGPKITRR